MKWHLFWLILTVLLSPFSSAEKYQSGRLDYDIVVGPWRSEYTLMSFFLMPGEQVTIRLAGKANNVPFTVQGENQGESALLSHYTYTARNFAEARTAVDRLVIRPQGMPAATLKLFTLTPASAVSNGTLNGYNIGHYPKQTYKGLEIYKAPLGFLEITADQIHEQLSPHYRLGQFLCKQAQGYPKYVVLQTRLLRKLEFLSDAANREGYANEGFVIMSGYRTPFYNAAIKNKLYSRHQWGGAADIYIDENPRDGVMDDLNKDGKSNIEDARALAKLIESVYRSPDYKAFIGGMGLYSATSTHGPFVHVDVRGFKARW